MNKKLVSITLLILLLCGCASISSAAKKTKKLADLATDDDAEEERTGSDSIETVSAEKIQDAIDDNDRNLLVIFFDNLSRCPACRSVLTMLEDIDDDIEASGWIDVVKTTDKHLAKDLGVTTYPSVVYYRRTSPILYDGDYSEPEQFMKWVRSHDEVAALELKDDDFEERTDSATPPEGALDWFVYFYDSRDRECSQYLPTWEAVAHRLRGLAHVGKLDVEESDDVAERFKIESKEDCPTFILFRRGKLYKYKDLARDIKSLTSFALHRFKEQRGHRVPDPPTKLEELYEELKEDLQDIFQEHTSIIVTAFFGGLTVILLTLAVYKIIKSRREKKTT